MTATEWAARTFLRIARAMRDVNAAQVELHERWLRRYGSVRSDG
ncbi:MAG: hypothetical protein ACR2LX_00745 [Jatrophihabitans sp.]